MTELTGWRLYYAHRGRLCSPFTGQLEPLDRVQHATCLHADHEPPATGCWCGFRLADNLAALAPAAAEMLTPSDMPGVLSRIKSETFQRARTPWGVPMTVLRRFDWPQPALVQVHARHAVRADDVSQNWAVIRDGCARQGLNAIAEGPGMWRARTLEIVGPILIGAPFEEYDRTITTTQKAAIAHEYRARVDISPRPLTELVNERIEKETR